MAKKSRSPEIATAHPALGSSNFTNAGLRGSLELNLGHYEDPVVGKIEGWFDELWEQATPNDLAAIYDRLMAEYSPYLIYLRVLFELYGQELEEELDEIARPARSPSRPFKSTVSGEHCGSCASAGACSSLTA